MASERVRKFGRDWRLADRAASRTQGAPIPEGIGATEDDGMQRVRGSAGTHPCLRTGSLGKRDALGVHPCARERACAAVSRKVESW
jgi:hypothetical protein